MDEPTGVEVILTHEPLPPYEPAPARSDAGAELLFHGRVRSGEGDREIRALGYEAYEGMAHKELHGLAEETRSRFELLDLVCWHRLGDVPVGEPSLRVVLRSRHRQEAIRALDWFVVELKRRVPIWKWGVAPDGERFPSAVPSSGPATAPGSDETTGG